MQKYIKNPRVIKAIQFVYANMDELKELAKTNKNVIIEEDHDGIITSIIIHTNIGYYRINNTDWIIIDDISGLHPCNDVTFRNTYTKF